MTDSNLTEINETECPGETSPPLSDNSLETVPKPALTRQRLLLIWVAAAVIILDQFSKYFIEAVLPLYRSWAPIPVLESVFRLSHVTNTGTAFGLFPAGSSLFAWAAVIVVLAILYYNYTLPAGQITLRLALGLQLGGAFGNLIDRIRLGHVTDFLDFGPWPVFNLADTSIVAGAALLAWLMWQEHNEQSQQSSLPPAVPDTAPTPSTESGNLDERPAN
ncbi:MAG: signal peptidase II [Anaerolineae bacterium]